MLVVLERFWRVFSLKNPFPVALSVTAGVGGWAWPISISDMCIYAPLCQFTKRDPSSASIAPPKKFLMVVHAT